MARRRARQRSRNDSANSTSAQRRTFTLKTFFGRSASNDASNGDEVALADPTGSSEDDPSAAIAEWQSQSTANPDLSKDGDTTKVGLSEIREELEQLEDAEFQIEDYPGDDTS